MRKFVGCNRIGAKHRWAGGTLVEICAVVGVIGILAAIALPAIASVRESSRRLTCSNNLNQVGMALMQFHSSKTRFPPGRDATQGRQHSWATLVLPYLEQQSLWSRYLFSERWDNEKNLSVSTTNLPVFRCPSTTEVCGGQSDYAGNYGSCLTGLRAGYDGHQAWSSGTLVSVNIPGLRLSSVSMDQIVDGLSNTLLVVESAGLTPEQGGGWANGHHNTSHDQGLINSSRSLRIFSDHPTGAQVLLCDQSVRFLSVSTELGIVGALCTRARGELLKN